MTLPSVRGLVPPKQINVMAFFDGQNLYQHAKEAFDYYHPSYDPIKLHHAVCAARGWRPTLTRFYTGVPSPIEAQMWSAWWSNKTIAMKRAGVHVTTRPIRYRKEETIGPDGKPKTITTPQEKGIDVRIALDLVSLARKKQFDVALIFSQDQDLQEVVQEVLDISKEQGRWMSICSAFPTSPTASTVRGIDKTDWFPMDKVFYDACLDPKDYRPATRK